MSIIIFFIVLAVLVLVHEFGHFIVAKAFGIKVLEFGLGFPPKIFTKKMGETLYSVNLVPFGGFVKIFGEDPHAELIEEEDKKRSFYYKPKYAQVAVLIAGVTFNVLFAWLILSFGYMRGLPASLDGYDRKYFSQTQLVITDVLSESPAEKAGIKAGDIIESISSYNKVLEKEYTPDNVRDFINSSSGEVEVIYKRGGEVFPPVSIKTSDKVVSGKQAIGIAMDEIGLLKLPFTKAFTEGAKFTVFMTENIFKGLVSFFGKMFVLKSDLSQVSGPIGIVGAVKEANSMGFSYLILLVALISINLALINLLPFPALDGGRIFFVLIEAIKGSPISPSFIRKVNIIGFVFLISLMLVVTFNDVIKLFR